MTLINVTAIAAKASLTKARGASRITHSWMKVITVRDSTVPNAIAPPRMHYRVSVIMSNDVLSAIVSDPCSPALTVPLSLLLPCRQDYAENET